ncbi:biosynthetic arginine decarboxylase [Psychrosphaera saromensis]|uniref:Arginine decarboxylase n=1 Tax=Psychrosphaera saromensis TaxID=716813 RepID=A0A2S7UWD0_9GAMM|nr:biosynthetic arginine decarboxylase [Psychrosphaera saromensis]PQJ54237.1 arginine decarboxylase [Psychrosphaera saromensis]GHB74862.1 biosynthetic arginine decarboxylase [Psychrosphaera saromensis]GLQ12663.1 biosynthetic arginine decarboxylase [Psychrosphaera saromensis]
MPNNTTDAKDWDHEDSEKLYGVSRWSKGYFSIGSKGDLLATPDHHQPNLTLNIQEIVEEMTETGIKFPAVIRFHDILRSQVEMLNTTFRRVIADAEYTGQYFGVFPIKVNQMREVVEEIVNAGEKFNYGLEAGSKPELMAALAYNTNKDSLTILNGYKDEEYFRLALLGQQIGRNIIIVIEKFNELKTLVQIAKEMGVTPVIGLRSKLMVKGKGKWKNSSGERAKFGLSYVEMLHAVDYLKQEGFASSIQLLHFHIGSQLTDIRSIKDAIQEASMVYMNLVKYGVPLQYIDVGGGLAVDYDGSQSTNNSSCNYSTEEYILDIVYGIKQTCDLNDIPHPNIVSESGRAITAHHSCVVAKVIGEIKPNTTQYDTSVAADEHILITNMREITQELTSENYQEMYNDLVSIKEQTVSAFNLGVLSLKDMAKMETLYWQTLEQINQHLIGEEFVPEQLMKIPSLLSSQYLVNFSVFQSTIDSWAIKQVLPIVPINRLSEKPTKIASLVDITCDSDGKIDHFIEANGSSNTLPLHELKDGEDYHIGIFLTGAYQDVMGDMHNLFGRLNEVHIYSYDDDPKDYYIEEVVKGSAMGDVLSTMQYSSEILANNIKKEIDKRVSKGQIKPRVGVQLTDFYENCLSSYTYLTDDKERRNRWISR